MCQTDCSYDVAKNKLLEYESNGMSTSDLYKSLLEQLSDTKWSNASFDIQIPRSVPDALDEEGPLT